MKENISGGSEKKEVLFSDITARLEFLGMSRERIWNILELHKGNLEEISSIAESLENDTGDFEHIHTSFLSGVHAGQSRLPIDAGEGANREGGLKQAFIQEVSAFVRQHFSEDMFERVFGSGMLERKYFCIGTKEKRNDANPFVDGETFFLKFQDRTIAYCFCRRTEFNHAEVNFVIHRNQMKELFETFKKELS